MTNAWISFSHSKPLPCADVWITLQDKKTKERDVMRVVWNDSYLVSNNIVAFMIIEPMVEPEPYQGE